MITSLFHLIAYRRRIKTGEFFLQHLWSPITRPSSLTVLHLAYMLRVREDCSSNSGPDKSYTALQGFQPLHIYESSCVALALCRENVHR